MNKIKIKKNNIYYSPKFDELLVISDPNAREYFGCAYILFSSVYYVKSNYLYTVEKLYNIGEL